MMLGVFTKLYSVSCSKCGKPLRRGAFPNVFRCLTCNYEIKITPNNLRVTDEFVNDSEGNEISAHTIALTEVLSKVVGEEKFDKLMKDVLTDSAIQALKTIVARWFV